MVKVFFLFGGHYSKTKIFTRLGKIIRLLKEYTLVRP